MVLGLLTDDCASARPDGMMSAWGLGCAKDPVTATGSRTPPGASDDLPYTGPGSADSAHVRCVPGGDSSLQQGSRRGRAVSRRQSADVTAPLRVETALPKVA